MRIAIVSAVKEAVQVLSRIVLNASEHRIAWIAPDGPGALRLCARDTPDLILMDLFVDEWGGVELTRRVMAENPCAVLIVTATVSGSTSGVFEAMGHGALDAVNTPVVRPAGIEGAELLLEKIATIGKLIGRDGQRRISAVWAKPAGVPAMVAIGSSTGGPKALSEILSRLPATLAATIVIVQHVDARFAPGMAEWLNSRSALRVQVVAEGIRPASDSVWLAGTNDHLVVRPDLTLGYTDEPRSSPYRPSADVFFRSAARHWPAKGIAALLTGMGRDGAEGLLALRRAGWQTLAQEESSCVVYGMPKAAAEIGAAERIASLEEIARLVAAAGRPA